MTPLSKTKQPTEGKGVVGQKAILSSPLEIVLEELLVKNANDL